MITARNSLLLSVLTMGIGLIPGLTPVAPAARVVLRVTPAVRAILENLRRIDVPAARRKKNWIGDRGQGSCVPASLVNLFHWQGRHDLADWWATHYANGETAAGLSAKLEAAGVRFAETRSGDETFLEWAIRTRRGAAVVVQNGSHMVNLVGLDRDEAQILDSNSPAKIESWPRERFMRDWKQSGGWAVTPVGTPAPPDPWQVKSISDLGFRISE